VRQNGLKPGCPVGGQSRDHLRCVDVIYGSKVNRLEQQLDLRRKVRHTGGSLTKDHLGPRPGYRRLSTVDPTTVDPTTVVAIRNREAESPRLIGSRSHPQIVVVILASKRRSIPYGQDAGCGQMDLPPIGYIGDSSCVSTTETHIGVIVVSPAADKTPAAARWICHPSSTSATAVASVRQKLTSESSWSRQLRPRRRLRPDGSPTRRVHRRQQPRHCDRNSHRSHRGLASCGQGEAREHVHL